MTPPTTPIGRDELALKRHRFFSDLLEAAHAAVEHRVRFDPLGPVVPEVPEPEAGNYHLTFLSDDFPSGVAHSSLSNFP
jgi:adenylyl cyclase-associated protein